MLKLLAVISNPIFRLFAEDTSKTAADCGGGKFLGIIPHWYEYLPFDKNCDISVNLQDNPEVLWKVGFAIVEIILRVGGLVAVGFIIYGGLLMMTSQGEPEGFKKAKTTIINALIGLVISVVASSIVIFVAGSF